MPVDTLLHQGEEVAVAVSHLDVFPNGFRINVVILTNPHRPRGLLNRMYHGPQDMPRIGVRFSDGRVGGREGGRGFMAVPKDEQGMPTQPYVGFGGGGGGSGGWRFGVWVFPLPPDGPLEIFLALPSPATEEMNLVVDGTAVRSAAERAKVIWT